MNHLFHVSVCLTIPFLEQGIALADIPAPPTEIVPATDPARSDSQVWMTMGAGGLLVCALIAVVIVRVRKSRQQSAQKETPPAKS